jgi:1-deoxy-D-xylulose-5-phosphate reductoisomerase
VLEAGGTSGAILNAANEAAVEAFLRGQIRFGQISELVREALDAVPATPVRSLDDIERADMAARASVTAASGGLVGEAVPVAPSPRGRRS